MGSIASKWYFAPLLGLAVFAATLYMKMDPNRLTGPELETLKTQLDACWVHESDAADKVTGKVTVKFNLDRSGTVQGEMRVHDTNTETPLTGAAGERARRAVLKCQPFKLPADKYETWSEVTFNFDPSEMLQ